MGRNITEIKEALSCPLFTRAMESLGYTQIATDEYFKHDFYYEDKEGIVYFNLDQNEFTYYNKTRTVSLKEEKVTTE